MFKKWTTDFQQVGIGLTELDSSGLPCLLCPRISLKAENKKWKLRDLLCQDAISFISLDGPFIILTYSLLSEASVPFIGSSIQYKATVMYLSHLFNFQLVDCQGKPQNISLNAITFHEIAIATLNEVGHRTSGPTYTKTLKHTRTHPAFLAWNHVSILRPSLNQSAHYRLPGANRPRCANVEISQKGCGIDACKERNSITCAKSL